MLEFYCLFSEHLGVLASYIQQFLTVFTIGLSLARFWKAFGISGVGGGLNPPNPPPRNATDCRHNLRGNTAVFLMLRVVVHTLTNQSDYT